MSHGTGYRDITATPNLPLYADHNRETPFDCRACGKPDRKRCRKPKWCHACDHLPLATRRAMEQRLRARKETK